MGGHITGHYFKIIRNVFLETADENDVLRLSREIGIPDVLDDNDQCSIVDYNNLMELGIKRFWPDLSIEQGLYRLGESVFLGFTDTVIGRVAMNLSVSHAKKLASRTPRHYECFIDWGKVSYADTGEKTYELRFENFKTSPHYDHGIMVAGTLAVVSECDITLTIHRFDNPAPGIIDADFDFRFELP
jgi:uncharacterized protein (TIGR02265 family)